MVHPYLRRRTRPGEPVDYPDERVRAVLEKTLGVPIFQEQAMRLAVVAAGFTPGEADQLRRAMGAWREAASWSSFAKSFSPACRPTAIRPSLPSGSFSQIQGFGDYGFPESHAASFALLVYVSAWLKHYYPAAFAARLINSQPMGFYAPGPAGGRRPQARRRGPPRRCQFQPVGLHAGSGQPHPDPPRERGGRGASLAARFSPDQGPFQSSRRSHRDTARPDAVFLLRGFCRSDAAAQACPQAVARASTFASVGLSRRDALWLALPEREPMPLFEGVDDEEPRVEMPSMDPLQETLTDYGTVGLTLRKHPMYFLRSTLDEMKVVPASDLGTVPNGSKLKVAGVVLMRQRPSTAKGVTFVTLEDETGMVNLVVWQAVWERHRRVAYTSAILLVEGTLQQEAGVIHVVAETLKDISEAAGGAECEVEGFSVRGRHVLAKGEPAVSTISPVAENADIYFNNASVDKPTIYLDTNIISAYWHEGRDVAAGACRIHTREWWKLERLYFSVFVSATTINELQAGSFRRQSDCLKTARSLRRLAMTGNAKHVLNEILEAGLIPETKPGDALPMAVSVAHEVDYLLTWNYAHLANPIVQERLEMLCQKLAMRPPLLVSPETIPQVRFGQDIRRRN